MLMRIDREYKVKISIQNFDIMKNYYLSQKFKLIKKE